MEWLDGKNNRRFSPSEACAPRVNIELGGQGGLALLVRLMRADVFSSDNGQKIILNVYVSSVHAVDCQFMIVATSTGVSVKVLVRR